MTPNRQIHSSPLRTNASRGFTMIELIVAIVVLMTGLIAVMQLVPAAMRFARTNRNDTTSTVVVQRLHDLMVQQPLIATTLTDPTGTFPCGGATVCNLGGGTVNGDFTAGAPLVNGQVNFTKAAVAGYSFTYIDPNDPTGALYDVRWAVVTSVRTIGPLTNTVVAKRYIIGARRWGDTTAVVSNYSSWTSR